MYIIVKIPIIDTCDDIFLKKYLRDLRNINLAVSNASKKVYLAYC